MGLSAPYEMFRPYTADDPKKATAGTTATADATAVADADAAAKIVGDDKKQPPPLPKESSIGVPGAKPGSVCADGNLWGIGIGVAKGL